MKNETTPSASLGKEDAEKERMKRLAPQFLDLLEQYAKDPGLLEGLEGACVAIVDEEVRTLEAKIEENERDYADLFRNYEAMHF